MEAGTCETQNFKSHPFHRESKVVQKRVCSAPGDRNSPAGSVSGPALNPDSQISRGRLCSKQELQRLQKAFVGKEQSFNYSNYSRSLKSGSLLGVSGKGLSAAWSQLPEPGTFKSMGTL